MKKIFIFTLLVSVVTLAGFWVAPKICMLMWPGSLHPNQSWTASLGLDARQAASLERLESSFRKESDKMCVTICGERMSLLRLMRAKPVDEKAVDGKIEEIGRLQIQLEKQIASHILEVKKGLTAEQSQAYLDRIQEDLSQSIRQSGYVEAVSSK